MHRYDTGSNDPHRPRPGGRMELVRPGTVAIMLVVILTSIGCGDGSRVAFKELLDEDPHVRADATTLLRDEPELQWIAGLEHDLALHLLRIASLHLQREAARRAVAGAEDEHVLPRLLQWKALHVEALLRLDHLRWDLDIGPVGCHEERLWSKRCVV